VQLNQPFSNLCSTREVWKDRSKYQYFFAGAVQCGGGKHKRSAAKKGKWQYRHPCLCM